RAGVRPDATPALHPAPIIVQALPRAPIQQHTPSDANRHPAARLLAQRHAPPVREPRAGGGVPLQRVLPAHERPLHARRRDAEPRARARDGGSACAARRVRAARHGAVRGRRAAHRLAGLPPSELHPGAPGPAHGAARHARDARRAGHAAFQGLCQHADGGGLPRRRRRDARGHLRGGVRPGPRGGAVHEGRDGVPPAVWAQCAFFGDYLR
ncbi:hypothetical protein B0H11DRAFT_1250795, partial [Mycena galericulata]